MAVNLAMPCLSIKWFYAESHIFILLYWVLLNAVFILDLIEQRALKNVNNCLKTNIYSYLDESEGQSHNLYLNAVHIFNTSLN